VTIDEKGTSTFLPQSEGLDRILTLNDIQRVKVLEAFIGLASHPPAK
jgi:hypothetical protein